MIIALSTFTTICVGAYFVITVFAGLDVITKGVLFTTGDCFSN
jgi:hypothetical protein